MSREVKAFEDRWDELVIGIKEGKVTKDNIATYLPDNIGERLELLNYHDELHRSALKSSIRGLRFEMFYMLIDLGARLTAKELSIILINTDIDLSVRKQFFTVAMEHIYERAREIRSLDDELFAHIAEIEDYVTYFNKDEFRNELVAKPVDRSLSFEHEFRRKIADNLKEVKRAYEMSDTMGDKSFYEAFKEKVLSYSVMTYPKFSKEGAAKWESLIDELSIEVPETKHDFGLRKRHKNSHETSSDIKHELKGQVTEKQEIRAGSGTEISLDLDKAQRNQAEEFNADEKTSLLKNTNFGSDKSDPDDWSVISWVTRLILGNGNEQGKDSKKYKE